MSDQNVKRGMSKASMVCAIISLVFALLPLLSLWFNLLLWVCWIATPLSIIFGIIAIVKKQTVAKTLVAIAIAVLAFFIPRILAEQYAEAAADSIENVANAVGSIQDMTEDLNSDWE